MSKILAVLLTIAAVAMFVPLTGTDSAYDVQSLQGSASITGLSMSASIDPTNEAAAASSSQSKVAVAASSPSSPITPGVNMEVESQKKPQGEASTGTAPALPELDALVMTEEKEPTEACALYGPFQETKLKGYYAEIQRLGVKSRMLIEPALATSKISIVVGSLNEESMKKTRAVLDKAGVRYQAPAANAKKLLIASFTDIVKAETFLNRVQSRLPGVKLQVEREAPEVGTLVQLVFLEMSAEDFGRVQSFVAKQGGRLRGCPY